MSYEDIETFTSHASSMINRASGNISVIQSLLWEIKVRYMDDPNKDLVSKTNNYIEITREELQKTLKDLDRVSEEMKRYNR